MRKVKRYLPISDIHILLIYIIFAWYEKHTKYLLLFYTSVEKEEREDWVTLGLHANKLQLTHALQ